LGTRKRERGTIIFGEWMTAAGVAVTIAAAVTAAAAVAVAAVRRFNIGRRRKV